jgi:hypothetical protein
MAKNLKLVAGFAPPEDFAALAAEKLASSGLSVQQGKRLGMTWHDATETKAHGGWGLPSLKINYFHPLTGKPLTAGANWPAFYRLRALRAPDPLPDDFPKYIQPPRTGVCAYFPRLVDWAPLLANPETPLMITEGELKAAKATAEGYPTIGLGGVNSYKSRTQGIDFLPELEAIVWPTREVFICYDSDLQSNKNVVLALNDLAETLLERGAVPKMLLLPELPGLEKTGLDDFLCQNHPDVLGQLMREQGVPLTLARPLWGLNKRYAYVRSLDRVVEQGDTALSATAAFRTAQTARFTENVVLPNGGLSTRKVAAADHWLAWPLRQDAQKLTYDPAKPPLSLVEVPGKEFPDYNMWTGWGVSPKEGDPGPFLKLVDHLFTDSEPEAKKWFLQWCAYPLQHPGTKLFSSVVIHGLAQGTGKSLVGYTLGKIYGKNFTEIKQDDIHNPFNEWAVRKQLIMGDDVTGSDKRQDRDMLKKLITQKELRINEKFTPSYTLPDYVNYLWTSNQPDAFFLEDGDRRFFIHEVSVQPLPDKFYARYDQLLRTSSFPAAVFHYLLNLDLTGFNPYGRALGTEAKTRMLYSAQSDLGNWVRDLVADPDATLLVGDVPVSGDLFTNKQLMHIYCASSGADPAKIPAKRLWAELARAGVQKVYGGKPFGKPQDRYYAIRRPSKWVRASLEQLKAHLDSLEASETPTEKKKKF